jgi:hypothetical protein
MNFRRKKKWEMKRPVRTRQLHLLLFTRKPDDKIVLKGRSSGLLSFELLPIPLNETVASSSKGEL